MKRTWLMVGLLAIAAGAGAAWCWQGQRATVWRWELAQLQAERAEAQQLQQKHARLAAAQVPEADRAAHEADRAAVARLRTEIDGLKRNVEVRERALAEETARRLVPPLPPPAPDVTLRLELGTNGGLALDGGPIDVDGLRTRLAALPAGTMFEVRVRQPKGANKEESELFRQRTEALSTLARDVAKERGLKMSFLIEAPK
jgi:hypothetical protein